MCVPGYRDKAGQLRIPRQVENFFELILLPLHMLIVFDICSIQRLYKIQINYYVSKDYIIYRCVNIYSDDYILIYNYIYITLVYYYLSRAHIIYRYITMYPEIYNIQIHYVSIQR